MLEWGCRLGAALLDILLPNICQVCGTAGEMLPAGRRVEGLRWCDGQMICRDCAEQVLTPAPVAGRVGLGDTPLAACGGMPTCAGLVGVVASWKYRGRRGLAWPLADLAQQAWELAIASAGAVDVLVPMPLHCGRRRERGFNQAELLARLLGSSQNVSVAPHLLRRTRETAQQAKLSSSGANRALNVSDAFAASPCTADAPARVGLIDDLVTSGATACAAAKSLRERGWRVSWVLAAGLAVDRRGA